MKIDDFERLVCPICGVLPNWTPPYKYKHSNKYRVFMSCPVRHDGDLRARGHANLPADAMESCVVDWNQKARTDFESDRLALCANCKIKPALWRTPHPSCHPTVEFNARCPDCGESSKRHGGDIIEAMEETVGSWNSLYGVIK